MDGGEWARGRITEEGRVPGRRSGDFLSDRKGRREGRLRGQQSKMRQPCRTPGHGLRRHRQSRGKAAPRNHVERHWLIACSNEVAFRDDHKPNSNEHTVLGLEIISGLSDELVDAVVRYHHSTLKSDDCPTDLSSDILRCVNIALVCNRLEELVYGPDPCPTKEALEAIRAETEEGHWPQEEAELLARLLSN